MAVNALERPELSLPAGGRPVGGRRTTILERRQTLLFFTGMVCTFTNALLQNMRQTFTLPNYATPTLALGLVCIFLLMNNKEVMQKLRRKAYMNIFVFYTLFFALTLYSAYLSKNAVPGSNPVTLDILFQLFVFESLCLVVYALATERTNELLNCLLVYNGILVVFNDLLMFGGIRFYAGEFEAFLVGTKFDVIYLHMNFIATFLVKLKLSRRQMKEARIPKVMLVTIAAIIVLIGVRVDCNTGMMGVLLLIALVYVCDRWPETVAKWLGSPWTFLFFLMVSMLFAYYVTWLLNLPVVKHFIEDTLHRSLTLTGRTDIYTAYTSVMRDNWVWGFGYGNAYPICMERFHYADTQNGILEWILQVGVVGTVAMVLVFIVIMLFYRKKASLTSGAPMLALLYVYILLGTVEITINKNFWLYIIVLFMLACSDPKSAEDTAIKPQFTPRQTKRRTRQLV